MSLKTEKSGSPSHAPSASPSATATVRQERDRFVAFSFAAADLLLEIEPEHGKILFISGAAQAMTGQSTENLKNTSLYSLLLPADRNLLHRFLGRIRHGGRMQPIPARMVRGPGDHRMVLLGACRLPYSENFYVSAVQVNAAALREADGSIRDESTGLMDRESFADKAQKVIAQTQAQNQNHQTQNHQTGSDVRLTFLEMSDLAPLTARLSRESTAEMYSSIGAYLRAASVDGDAAALIDDNKYGVIHDTRVTSADLQEYLAELTRDFDPARQGATVATAAMRLESETIGAEDTARAFVYCINKFAHEGSQNFTLRTLSESISGMMEEAVERLSTFKSAVTGEQFRVVFQPIVSLADQSIHHYEALSRFDGGKSPFQVISFAEEVGMIQEFDLAVCQKVLDHILSLDALGKHYNIAINLSAQSLESSVFLESLRRLLAPHKALRKNILFELTESSQIHNFEYVNNALQTLRRDGHHVCLDDVGAGATSFHYIRSLHVDYIKIDGSYIRAMTESARDAAFVRALTMLSHDLRIKTIAEMVEREEEASLLRQMNVDYAQGYLFGKPAPVFAELQPKAALKG
jgi:EAL domain-containing protein (putative c-di-GMP-specific phosphodiesterase class I)